MTMPYSLANQAEFQTQFNEAEEVGAPRHVRIWNVYTQTFEYTACPSNEVLASLSSEERAAVEEWLA
jgi:hypothetical protein